jgi:hypothetical protein
VIDRFFDEVCVFGPEHSVSKKGLFEAWESWCYDSGEEPGKQNGFTRDMKDRGKVRGFGDGKSNGARVWKGIGLAGSDPEDGGVENTNDTSTELSVPESDPEPPRPEKVTLPQKSCKHVGVAGPQGHFSEDSENFSTDGPPEGKFPEIEEKVTLVPQIDPAVLTGPTSWTFDGIEIDYMPEGE